MENAERDIEINRRKRRNTLPRVYGLRATQFYGQLRSKATKLQVTTQNSRHHGHNDELYTYPFCGTLNQALK